MRKWPFILKIGGFITLCLFAFEYLHPSAVGVRACNVNLSECNVPLDNKSLCQKQDKSRLMANAGSKNFSKTPLTHSDKIGLEKNFIIHAMITGFISSIYWIFPVYKFIPVKKFIHKQLHIEDIYRPPRLSFIITSN